MCERECDLDSLTLLHVAQEMSNQPLGVIVAANTDLTALGENQEVGK